MPILEWLGLVSTEAIGRQEDGLAEIERRLDTLDRPRARYLACFAYLLGRVARADHHVSDVERAAIESLMVQRGGLTPEQASIAVAIATAHGLRFGGTEDFLVAREFAALASRDDKLALLECLFAVSASDESIATKEDNEIRRVAAEINVTHEDFVAARQRYVAHLEVLRHSLRD